MKLSSEVIVNFIPPGITHFDKIYLIGSCFTDHIAHKLKESGFHIRSNPHGILYNPVSIRQSLQEVLNNKQYFTNDLFYYEGLWHSFHHHGSFSGKDPNVVCQKINQTIAEHHIFLKNAQHLFITLGTAWMYRKKSTGNIVANCHKVPGYEFEKILLDIDEEKKHWIELIDNIQLFAPEISIHFTISPVKHLRDGFFENNLSKGLLHILVYELIQQKKLLKYFPSYEIMQDELRDYRFYDRDMAHPNSLAVDFIWEKFNKAYFANTTKEICEELLQLRKLFSHRLIYDSDVSNPFEKKRNEAKMLFIQKYPFIQIDF